MTAGDHHTMPTRRWFVIFGLAVTLTPLAAAADLPHPTLPSVPDTKLQNPAPLGKGPYLPVPRDATLDGEVKPISGGYDERIFRVNKSYEEVVDFYDRTFAARHAQVVSRVVAPDGVTFEVRRSGHEGIGTVVVRKTTPATLIETNEPW
jgi:hypothetical protein